MAWGVYLQDTALDAVSVYVQRIDQWLSGPERSFPLQVIPGRHGALIQSDPSVGARTLRIHGTVTPATRTVAERLTSEDAVKVLAYQGLIRVTMEDTVNAPRFIEGVCASLDFTTREHPLVATMSDMVLTVTCPDPTWQDVAGRVYQFGTTATPIPLGTAPTGGLLRINAPAWSANVTNPVITYASAAGLDLASLTFTTTLTAGADYLEIDLDRQTALEYTNGTSANALTTLTAGDFFWLDPADGNYTWGSFPTLRLSSGAGTPSGFWLGRRRFL